MGNEKPTIDELIKAYKTEKDADVARRTMLVIHVERDGMTRTGAAEYLCMARSWGVKWYGRYLKGGLPGLQTRPRSGRPPFVSKRDMKKVWRTLKKTTCWTAEEARDLIKKMTGAEYRIPHVRAMMRGRGYSMKVPVGRHVRRASPQKISGFQRRMRRLIPKKRADGYIRCVQDECISVADARPRKRVYTLKGKRAVYTYTGSHAKTVVFGLITDDGRSFFKQYDKFTKDQFADFLKEAYAYFGKPIMMILDRAPQHKAKIIQETLKELDGKVELEFLPPGCPDLSAIEEVWRQMKRAVLDVTYTTLATMRDGITRWLASSVPVLDIERYLYRVV